MDKCGCECEFRLLVGVSRSREDVLGVTVFSITSGPFVIPDIYSKAQSQNTLKYETKNKDTYCIPFPSAEPPSSPPLQA